MDLDSLYLLVTEGIRRAEVLSELSAPGASAAHLDVSLLEERIAEQLPASDAEGAIARRGAVRAAVAAGDLSRARRLVTRYVAEVDIGPELHAELVALADGSGRTASERERSLEARYPHVSVTVGIGEVRRLARAWISQGAPFPIG